MNLILFGYKAAGKSYFGKKLAIRLSYIFMDTDYMVESVCLMGVREICEREGEEFFREVEKEVIKSLEGKKNMIVALGGGAILDPDNVKLLTKLGTLVYLQVDKSILKERLLKGPVPTFLDAKDLDGSFERMYEKRREVYESIPSIWLDANREEEKVLEDLISIVHGK